MWKIPILIVGNVEFFGVKFRQNLNRSKENRKFDDLQVRH